MRNEELKKISENWDNLSETTKEFVLDLIMEYRKGERNEKRIKC